MTDLPTRLSPRFVDSFAYLTYKDRLPVILVKIIDSLYRNKHHIIQKHGDNAAESIKYISGELSRLRHELTTNKPITKFTDNLLQDERMWNESIDVEIEQVSTELDMKLDSITWFQTSFLFGENYMYRRIQETVLLSGLKCFDQFGIEKREATTKGINTMVPLTDYLKTVIDEMDSYSREELFMAFTVFTKMCLWGNEADMSLTVKDENSKLTRHNNNSVVSWHPSTVVTEHDNLVLRDDCDRVFERLIKLCNKETRGGSKPRKIMIFLDNTGIELISDLHFVEFLLSSPLAKDCQFEIVVKPMPWYVSDVTAYDFKETLKEMANYPLVNWLAQRLLDRMQPNQNGAGSIRIIEPFFITSPYSFCDMKKVDPEFYQSIQEADLAIFKGDLNYRKLITDRYWPVVETSFETGLNGFHPTNILALRVLKCDTIVGLTKESVERAVAMENESGNQALLGDWRIACKYAVVQSYLIKDNNN